MAKRITDLKRSDVPGALAFYREHLAAGTWKPEWGAQLQRLQDDPTELRHEIAQVRAALK